MTPGYKARRAAKHADEKASNAANRILGGLTPLMRAVESQTQTFPRLAFLNGKQFKRSDGGRKNRPGHSFEHEQANNDNRNPYFRDGSWFWYDEGYQDSDPYVTRDQAEAALNEHVKWLNTPREASNEDLGLSGDITEPVQD